MDTLTLFALGWPHGLLGGVSLGTAVALPCRITGQGGSVSSVFSSLWSYVVNRLHCQ